MFSFLTFLIKFKIKNILLKLKLFIPSDSNEFSYIINPILSHNKENFEYFCSIGKLITKTLLDDLLFIYYSLKLILKFFELLLYHI